MKNFIISSQIKKNENGTLYTSYDVDILKMLKK